MPSLCYNLNMQDLDTLQSVIRKFCDDRNWDQFHNLKDLLISLNLESSEALEHVQWKNDDELEVLMHNSKELGEELADVLYWTLLIANKTNINLGQAFLEKMKLNEEKYPIDKAKDTHKKYTDLT